MNIVNCISGELKAPASQPWAADCLAKQIQDLTEAVKASCHVSKDTGDSLVATANFHLEFLEHHLKNALFPDRSEQEYPPVAFASDPSRRYLSTMVASARPGHPCEEDSEILALNAIQVRSAGGKPVTNQSALHGFHVFEGLQLLASVQESTGYRFGYTFLREKVAKLIDGIIRLRFAVHMLKAKAVIRHLESLHHADAPNMNERYFRIVYEILPTRRAQAERAMTQALMYFIETNRAEMASIMNKDPDARFYVRVEAQGGNRESIGQGPLGVGQSTLQILGQLAKKVDTPARLVLNLGAPPRMHTLTGPYVGSPFFPLLNNHAVHHGNMAHQHLSSEIAQPHGSDMLMVSAEVDREGKLQEALIAETNFSNIGFDYEGLIVFPKSESATYGLIQHVTREALRSAFLHGKAFEGIRGFEHKRISVRDFMGDLRKKRVTGAFVMGSMPLIRPVCHICLDETLFGGAVTNFVLNVESRSMKDLLSVFQEVYDDQIVWE